MLDVQSRSRTSFSAQALLCIACGAMGAPSAVGLVSTETKRPQRRMPQVWLISEPSDLRALLGYADVA